MAEMNITCDTDTGTTHVNGARIKDPDITAYLADVPEENRPDRFETALLMGVIALRTTETASQVDFVEKRFDRLERHLLEHIDDVFGEDGDLNQLLEHHFGEDGELLEQVFDPDREGTPLQRLEQSISQDINTLQTALGIDKGRREERRRSPLKGRDFEDVLEELLGEITNVTDDRLDRRTDDVGLDGHRKGDFVVTLDGRSKRIVFEAKDERTSVNELESYMQEAIENRNAAYGVFVARSVDNVPTDVGWFKECDDQILALALGDGEDDELADAILRIGYKWARRRVLDQVRATQDALDETDIWHEIEAAERRLSELTELKKKSTRIQNIAGEMWDDADELKSELETHLEAINAELDRASSH